MHRKAIRSEGEENGKCQRRGSLEARIFLDSELNNIEIGADDPEDLSGCVDELYDMCYNTGYDGKLADHLSCSSMIPRVIGGVIEAVNSTLDQHSADGEIMDTSQNNGNKELIAWDDVKNTYVAQIIDGMNN